MIFGQLARPPAVRVILSLGEGIGNIVKGIACSSVVPAVMYIFIFRYCNAKNVLYFL